MSNAIPVAASRTASPADGVAPAAASAHRISLADDRPFDPTRITPIRHDYHRHPLMQLDALQALAERLYPAGQCRFVERPLAPDSPFEHQPRSRDRRDIAEVFERLEEPGSWLALYDTQKDPTYRRFLEEVIGGVEHLLAPRERVFDVRGFFFLSAPPSVTPFHIDREHNFWLQVHGRKTMHVWDRHDPQVVAPADVERFVVRRVLDGVKLQPGTLERATVLDCGPGDGVYFPSTTPHMTRTDDRWVRPGDGVSVSVGVVFYTDRTRRDANAHACNYLLRRAGLQPRPPGLAGWLDGAVKAPIGRAAIGTLKALRGYEPPPGF